MEFARAIRVIPIDRDAVIVMTAEPAPEDMLVAFLTTHMATTLVRQIQRANAEKKGIIAITFSP